MSWGPGTLKTNRISCPRLRLIVKGWFSSVCPLHNGWLSSLSAQVWSLISSIRHRQATPRVEEPGFPGLTLHGCLTFAGVQLLMTPSFLARRIITLVIRSSHVTTERAAAD